MSILRRPAGTRVRPGGKARGKGKGKGNKGKGPGQGQGKGPGQGQGQGQGNAPTGVQAAAATVAAQGSGDNNTSAHAFAAAGGGGAGGGSSGGGPAPSAPAEESNELLEIGIWSFETSGNGGTHTDTAYEDRVLNTENYNGIAGASLASNAITLPAGTYEIKFHAAVSGMFTATVRLWNDTLGALIQYGCNDVPDLSQSTNILFGFTRQVFATETIISMDTLGRDTQATTGHGQSVASGSNNVFALIMVRKVG